MLFFSALFVVVIFSAVGRPRRSSVGIGPADTSAGNFGAGFQQCRGSGCRCPHAGMAILRFHRSVLGRLEVLGGWG